MGRKLAIVKPWDVMAKEFGVSAFSGSIISDPPFSEYKEARMTPQRIILIDTRRELYGMQEFPLAKNHPAAYPWLEEVNDGGDKESFWWIDPRCLSVILPGEIYDEIPRNYEDMGEDES